MQIMKARKNEVFYNLFCFDRATKSALYTTNSVLLRVENKEIHAKLFKANL